MIDFKKIKTVFIDLDDTIWDFSANSKVAMKIVYEKYGLQRQCPYDDFIACYMPNNESLWTRYHHGEITKEYLKRERFRRSFEQCGIACNDPMLFDYDYLETIVTLKQVVDGVVTLPEGFLAQQYVDTAVLHQFFVFLIVVKGDHRNGAFPLQLLQGFAYARGAA